MEQNQEFLTGKEHDDYMDEISSVMTDLTGKVLFIADKHNVDRDNAALFTTSFCNGSDQHL